MFDSADLRGHSILIVESDASPYVVALQAAIERTGAESLVARSTEAALDRLKEFRFSAAVILAGHEDDLAGQVGLPFLLYGTKVMPARPEIIVAALVKLLAA